MSHHEYKTPTAFDMALQAPVFYMMRRGIRVDVDRKNELRAQAQGQWDGLQSKLNVVAGSPLNTSSSKQMRQILYGDLKLPVRRKQGKITCDEDALRSLLAFAENKMQEAKTDATRYRYQRAYLTLMLTLKIRTLRKRKESYLDVELDDDGRMRCMMAVGGTETGRFSHSKTLWGTGCNLATIPRELRTMFIADEGYEIAEFDLNRGESWVYAYLSGDPELIRIHSTFGDFHSETASAISTSFGKVLSVDEVKRLYKSGDEFGYRIRFLGKKVNHASAYRMGPYRGAEVINGESDDSGITVTVAQVREAQKLWLRKYSQMERWWESIERQLNETRTLTTPYGRRRTFYGFWSDHLFKEATAYVPQSTSVDYLNYGMLRVYNELVLRGAYGLELLHQNHDSILVQYKIEHRDEVIPEIIERLTSTVVVNGHEISIPIEGSYGRNWKELEEWTH